MTIHELNTGKLFIKRSKEKDIEKSGETEKEIESERERVREEVKKQGGMGIKSNAEMKFLTDCLF